MTIGLVRTAWAGTSGGPGLTQLYFQDAQSFGEITASQAQAAVNAVRAFWQGISSYLPDEIALTVSPVVDMYDVASGQLEASVSAATAPTAVVGSSTLVFSMPSGFKINLNTTRVRNGRRVRGGIFVVPASSNAFATNGAIGSAVRTAINTQATTMLGAFTTAGLQLVVFSRPLDADQPNGPRSGDVAPITSMETNEKGAVLRGRRD